MAEVVVRAFAYIYYACERSCLARQLSLIMYVLERFSVSPLLLATLIRDS